MMIPLPVIVAAFVLLLCVFVLGVNIGLWMRRQ